MKYLNKIAALAYLAVLGLTSLTSCEGGELYSVDAPDWITDRIDSIRNAKQPDDPDEPEGLMEDVYNIGNVELTSPFFTLGKTYIVPAGVKWQAQFNLTVNPDKSITRTSILYSMPMTVNWATSSVSSATTMTPRRTPSGIPSETK